MRIQYLNGGLANQVFQYIFFRFGQLSDPDSADEWFIDDSFFFLNNIHNGYELEKVFPNVHVNLLSRFFDSDSWNMLLENKRNGISIPQSLVNLGYDVKFIAETLNYNKPMHNPFNGEVLMTSGANKYEPDIIKVPGDVVYYHGYWINPGYANAFADTILPELEFSDISDLKNAKIARNIIASDSCAVHIRRGDYVNLGWDSPCSFYKKSVEYLRKSNPEICFFIFSDDIPWCKVHADELGLTDSNVYFVTGNDNGKNYIDLQLMTYAKYMIFGKSAFPYLALMLSLRCEQYISE